MSRKPRKGPPEIECTAYHEAGHAVVAIEMGRAIKYVTIEPDEDAGSLGHIRHGELPARIRRAAPWYLLADYGPTASDTEARLWIERDVIISFAGGIAEARFRGRKNHIGASRDMNDAIGLLLSQCGCPDEAGKYAAWLWARAHNHVHLDVTWGAIKHLAGRLLEERTISGRRARQLYVEGTRLAYEEVIRTARAAVGS